MSVIWIRLFSQRVSTKIKIDNPDSIDIDDIKTILRNKFSQLKNIDEQYISIFRNESDLTPLKVNLLLKNIQDLGDTNYSYNPFIIKYEIVDKVSGFRIIILIYITFQF